MEALMKDAQFQYVQGQARPTFAALLARYEAESAAAVVTLACQLDVPYGSAARQTFDWFEAQGTPEGVLIYFHAGYWQSRDKSTFRFIAPAYTAAGFHVALVNYPLCPSVSLPALIDAVQASIPVIHKRAPDVPIVLSGHSAGAHIAAELALRQGQESAVVGLLAMSGIFDLQALLQTTLNEKLMLDASTAHACSPLHRLRAALPPAVVVVGADETPAFLAQSQIFQQAWAKAGNRASLHIEPNTDHFSLLEPFSTPGSALFNQTCVLFPRAG